MEDAFGIGDKLAKLRHKNKLTLEQVADGLGIPRSTYYDYEQGNVLPKIDFIHKAAVYFSVDPMVFFSGTQLTFNQENNQVANGYIHQQHNVPIELVEKWMRASEERENRLIEFVKEQTALMKTMAERKS